MILLALFKISYNKKFEKNPKAFMSISVACPCFDRAYLVLKVLIVLLIKIVFVKEVELFPKRYFGSL